MLAIRSLVNKSLVAPIAVLDFSVTGLQKDVPFGTLQERFKGGANAAGAKGNWKMRKLFLYGPPGVGKTTLGKVLAERMNLPFIDLDRVVQNEAGCPIKDIFAKR